MASTYLIAPSPKWYFYDAFGAQAAGGSMETTSSLDHTTPRFVFSDLGGNFPYLDPISLDRTGGSPVPMYWEINEVDLYYLVVKDKNGNIIFSVDHFPTVGGGGSTPVTSNIDIENHVINGQFIFIDALNSADSTLNPIPLNTPIRLAPASGFFKDATGHYVNNLFDGNSGWLFELDGGAGQTGFIEFVDVTAIGTGVPSAPTANATRFFRYELQIAGALQTAAYLYQTVPQVETFSGQLLTITFDTRTTAAGNPQGTFEIFQDFGTGGAPTTPGVPSSANFNFSSGAWARQTLQLTVASVVGKIKGTNGDDHIEIIWNFPLNTLGAFEITNLQVQIGNFGLTPYIYQDYNQDQYKVLIDLITFGNIAFQTGDYIFSDSTSKPGWLIIFNDAQFIGKTAASAATSFGMQYKNLYILWWTVYNQAQCIVNGGRGVSALADFNADKRMSIPQLLVNHVIAAAGNSIPFGYVEGAPINALVAANLPPHEHTIDFADAGTGSAPGSSNPGVVGTTVTGPGPGVSAPFSIMQPTHYKNLFVKL